MPRIARVVAVDYPHHIIQRGNNRQKVFFARDTRARYLSLLQDYTRRWDASILAYCLMTNHVHLLIKPHQPESLAKIMQGVTLCYTQYINKRYSRSGRLWESRYHSCVVDEEAYLWAVARYIEQNPVRAKIVPEPEEYAYSSAPGHIKGMPDEIISEELFIPNERDEYIKFLKAKVTEKEISQIRYTTKTGKPLGSKRFIEKVRKLLGRDFKIKLSAKAVK
jgi:putative transposase